MLTAKVSVLDGTAREDSHNSDKPPSPNGLGKKTKPPRALGVHLMQGQLLPFVHAAQLTTGIYGVQISPGALVVWINEAGIALQGAADDIAGSLHTGRLVQVDEPGLCVAGKLHRLHVVANEIWRNLSVLFINNLGERTIRMPKVKQKSQGVSALSRAQIIFASSVSTSIRLPNKGMACSISCGALLLEAPFKLPGAEQSQYFNDACYFLDRLKT